MTQTYEELDRQVVAEGTAVDRRVMLRRTRVREFEITTEAGAYTEGRETFVEALTEAIRWAKQRGCILVIDPDVLP